MIVFIAMAIVVAFTAGFAACFVLCEPPADPEQRYIDALARRDREVARRA